MINTLFRIVILRLFTPGPKSALPRRTKYRERLLTADFFFQVDRHPFQKLSRNIQSLIQRCGLKSQYRHTKT